MDLDPVVQCGRRYILAFHELGRSARGGPEQRHLINEETRDSASYSSWLTADPFSYAPWLRSGGFFCWEEVARMLQPGRKVRTKNERRINAPPAKLAFSVRCHCITHSINSCNFVQSRLQHGAIIGISRDIMPKKGLNSSIIPCVYQYQDICTCLTRTSTNNGE